MRFPTSYIGVQSCHRSPRFQSQVRSQFPIVLEESSKGAVALPHSPGKTLAVSNVGRKPQQKVRLGGPGILCIEADLAGCAIVGDRGNVVVPIADALEPELHVVRAVDECQSVFKLNRGLVEDLRRIDGTERKRTVE